MANKVTEILINRIRKRLEGLQPSNAKYRSALQRIGFLIEAETKLNIVKKRPRRGGGSKGLVDTGRLLNSINSVVTTNANRGIITVGSFGVPYAAIHEFGGVIKPVRAKMLAIPLSRKFRRDTPRRFPDLFIHKTDDGRIFLARDNGGVLEVAYRLVFESRIPARPYLEPAVRKVAPRATQIIAELWRKSK